MGKKLYKNTDRKMVSGVLAGFSEYLDIDVTIVRIGYVVIALLTELFPLLVLYIIMAFLLPEKDAAYRSGRDSAWRKEDTYDSKGPAWKKDDSGYRPDDTRTYQDEPSAEPRETPRDRYKTSGGSFIPKDNEGYGPEGYREIKEDDEN